MGLKKTFLVARKPYNLNTEQTMACNPSASPPELPRAVATVYSLSAKASSLMDPYREDTPP